MPNNKHVCPKCGSTWTRFMLSSYRGRGDTQDIWYTRNWWGNEHHMCLDCDHNWWRK